jgi:peptidoglycan/xylan/chitin deacetylase (PgdA/CDA1 family)
VGSRKRCGAVDRRGLTIDTQAPPIDVLDPGTTRQRSTSALGRLLSPLEPLELGGRPAGDDREWLRANDWHLYTSIDREPVEGDTIKVFQDGNGRQLRAVQADDGNVFVPFGFDDAYLAYLTESWAGSASQRRLSNGQLQMYYRIKHLLPRRFWLAARRAYIHRGRRRTEFPDWPLDRSVEKLLRFYAHCLLVQQDREAAPFAWFWPGAFRAAVILTHDVESSEGLRLALELCEVEEKRGLRSSFNIVGGDYAIDYGIVNELRARGFEVGLHGLVHDRSLFSSRESFEEQLPQLEAAASRLGSVGFRSPATYRNPEWMQEVPADYDSTFPLSDPYEPQPGGCCSIWPYFLGSLVELPYTMPQDHTIFTLLGEKTPALWLDQMARLEQSFGLIELLSHPDRGYLGDRRKRALYELTLDVIAANDRLWKPLPRELASWWRKRDAGDQIDQRYGSFHRSEHHSFAVLQPPETERVQTNGAH